jgi:hypothetical protein
MIDDELSEVGPKYIRNFGRDAEAFRRTVADCRALPLRLDRSLAELSCGRHRNGLIPARSSQANRTNRPGNTNHGYPVKPEKEFWSAPAGDQAKKVSHLIQKSME